MALTTVLFDLDGTLLDTVLELTTILNQMLEGTQYPTVPISIVRDTISQGAAAILQASLGIDKSDVRLKEWHTRYLNLYETSIGKFTQPYPGVIELIKLIETQQLRWGVVTNRLARHAKPLLQKFNLSPSQNCIVTADTLNKSKPDPAPLLHACELLDAKPEQCVYIGDAHTDIIAGKQAGMKTLIALYGYIPAQINPHSWEADGGLKAPIELLQWLRKYTI